MKLLGEHRVREVLAAGVLRQPSYGERAAQLRAGIRILACLEGLAVKRFTFLNALHHAAGLRPLTFEPISTDLFGVELEPAGDFRDRRNRYFGESCRVRLVVPVGPHGSRGQARHTRGATLLSRTSSTAPGSAIPSHIHAGLHTRTRTRLDILK